MEWFQKRTKIRGADKCTQIAKKNVEIEPKSMENVHGAQQKNDAEKHAKKNAKKTLEWVPQLDNCSGFALNRWWPKPH